MTKNKQYSKINKAKFSPLTFTTVIVSIVFWAMMNNLFPVVNDAIKWLLYIIFMVILVFLGNPSGRASDLFIPLIKILENGDSPQEKLWQIENIIKMAVIEWNMINDSHIREYYNLKLIKEEENKKKD